MGKGSKVVVINGIFHGLHGEIADLTTDGRLIVLLGNPAHGSKTEFTQTFKPFDLELEERKDLWNHLI